METVKGTQGGCQVSNPESSIAIHTAGSVGSGFNRQVSLAAENKFLNGEDADKTDKDKNKSIALFELKNNEIDNYDEDVGWLFETSKFNDFKSNLLSNEGCATFVDICCKSLDSFKSLHGFTVVNRAGEEFVIYQKWSRQAIDASGEPVLHVQYEGETIMDKNLFQSNFLDDLYFFLSLTRDSSNNEKLSELSRKLSFYTSDFIPKGLEKNIVLITQKSRLEHL